MARAMSVDCVAHEFPEDQVVDPAVVSQLLKENPGSSFFFFSLPFLHFFNTNFLSTFFFFFFKG